MRAFELTLDIVGWIGWIGVTFILIVYTFNSRLRQFPGTTDVIFILLKEQGGLLFVVESDFGLMD